MVKATSLALCTAAFVHLHGELGARWGERLYAWAPVIDPEAEGQELGWLTDAPWAKVALVITVALFVLTLGSSMAKRAGRRRGNTLNRRDFSLEVARLESLPRTPIAEAHDGPVHFEGVIASASETLGGEDGRERVYFNRAGAGRRTAVASELVLVRDESGQVSIEDLDGARVIAAKERRAGARVSDAANISLRIGDRVQLLGYFRGEVHGHDEAPEQRVYGVLGGGKPVQVRVMALDDPPADPPPADTQAEPLSSSQPEPPSETEDVPTPAP